MGFGAQEIILKRNQEQARLYNAKQQEKSYEPGRELEKKLRNTLLENEITLMIQSRDVFFAYWGFDNKTLNDFKSEFGSSAAGVLRLYSMEDNEPVEVFKKDKIFKLDSHMKHSEMNEYIINEKDRKIILSGKGYFAKFDVLMKSKELSIVSKPIYAF